MKPLTYSTEAQHVDRERLASKSSAEGRAAQRRLIAYSGMAVLLLAFLIFRGLRPSSETALTPVDLPPPTPVAAEPDSVHVPLARIDPELLKQVRDDNSVARAYLEPEALRHLVDQASRLVYGDLETLGVEAVEHSSVLSNPSEYRGRPIWILGHLQTIDEIPGPFGELSRGTILDLHQQPWAFLAVLPPEELRVGDVVRAAGFFFKVHDMPGPLEAQVSQPLLVAEEVLRSALPLRPVTKLRSDLFDRVRDDDLAEASKPVESPEFFELLSYVQHAAEEDFYPADGAIIEHPTGRLMQRTAEFRGQVVRVSGTLALVEQVPLGPRGQNPLGIPMIWRLWLANQSGPSVVYSFQDPGNLVPERDIVDADGVYFRRFAYENRLGKPYTAAVILARKYARFARPPDLITPLVTKMALVMVGILGIFLFFAGRNDRASAAKARSERIQRQQRMTRPHDRLHSQTHGDQP
ncbi:MAG: hypothetical protein ACT4PU_00275 [Planctomycetota bacterium]